jgi:hypothetical protein
MGIYKIKNLGCDVREFCDEYLVKFVNSNMTAEWCRWCDMLEYVWRASKGDRTEESLKKTIEWINYLQSKPKIYHISSLFCFEMLEKQTSTEDSKINKFIKEFKEREKDLDITKLFSLDLDNFMKECKSKLIKLSGNNN